MLPLRSILNGIPNFLVASVASSPKIENLKIEAYNAGIVTERIKKPRPLIVPFLKGVVIDQIGLCLIQFLGVLEYWSTGVLEQEKKT